MSKIAEFFIPPVKEEFPPVPPVKKVKYDSVLDDKNCGNIHTSGKRKLSAGTSSNKLNYDSVLDIFPPVPAENRSKSVVK